MEFAWDLFLVLFGTGLSAMMVESSCKIKKTQRYAFCITEGPK